jgi:GNAT superfamily N-acetyltransferase
MLEKTDTVKVLYARENFLEWNEDDWDRFKYLANLHGRELWGIDADLNLEQYRNLQNSGRLIMVTARLSDNTMIGYSSHFWHRHLHFNVRIAQDDAWFVLPEFRDQGIGRELRLYSIEEFKKDGVKFAFGRLKTAHPHDSSMLNLGYKPYESVYILDVTKFNKNDIDR